MLKFGASPTRTVYILNNLSVALSVAILVMVSEYAFRHYLLFLMPTFGMLVVNDMISLLLVYSLLLVGIGRLRQTNWRIELAGLWQTLQDSVRSWKFALWFLLLTLCMNLLSLIDKWLVGSFALPMVVNEYRNPILWLSQWASLLKVVSLLLVNGLSSLCLLQKNTFGAASSRFVSCVSCRFPWLLVSQRYYFRSSMS